MGELEQVVSEMDPITLKEMDSVKLQDRTDTKFVFNIALLPGFLKELSPAYRILDVNGVRFNRYSSLYYDTPGYNLYLKHHAGKLNRYKVRYRNYVDSNLFYLEIKFKSNKDRTVKKRIKRKEVEQIIAGSSEEFLKENSPFSGADLKPQIWIDYTRLTLVSRLQQERLTFDIGLRFRKDGQDIPHNDLVIAELKQDRAKSSVFKALMKRYHIREGAISKYCYGISSTVNVKKNNFKPKVMMISKALAA